MHAPSVHFQLDRSCFEEPGSSRGSRTDQDQGEFVQMALSAFTVSTVAIELLQLIMFSHGACKWSPLITSLKLYLFSMRVIWKEVKEKGKQYCKIKNMVCNTQAQTHCTYWHQESHSLKRAGRERKSNPSTNTFRQLD